MEPRIQYAQTADGVSIAFWTLGEDTPLVHMPLLFSHIQLEWEFPECRHYETSRLDNVSDRFIIDALKTLPRCALGGGTDSGKAVGSLFGLREPVAGLTPAGRSLFWEQATGP